MSARTFLTINSLNMNKNAVGSFRVTDFFDVRHKQQHLHKNKFANRSNIVSTTSFLFLKKTLQAFQSKSAFWMIFASTSESCDKLFEMMRALRGNWTDLLKILMNLKISTNFFSPNLSASKYFVRMMSIFWEERVKNKKSVLKSRLLSFWRFFHHLELF